MVVNKDKYTVAVGNTGSVERKLNGKRHCDTGPAITWISGWTFWYEKGEFLGKWFEIQGEYISG